MRKLELFVVMSLFAIMLFVTSGFAQEYYADLEVIVNADGTVLIDGITNDQSLAQGSYAEFTSKKGAYWLLNISSEKNYSDYILVVNLPKGAEFNYLKSSGRSRVSYDDSIRIIISGTGTIDLVIQYRIENVSRTHFFLWWTIVFVGVILLGIFSWKMSVKYLNKKRNSKKENASIKIKKSKKSSLKKKKNNENFKSEFKVENKVRENKVNVVQKERAELKVELNGEKLNLLKQTLAENQVKIIELLIQAGGSLTQKQLQHRSELPKATLSRNVDSLHKKNIIIKQSRGMTNMLTINKELIE